jgi:methyltransferase (TIGR00027 family)
MREPQASRTAVGVAVLRAAHQFLDAEPKILVDPIAVGLIPEASEAALRAAVQHLQQPHMRRMRANFVLRSRFTEDRLEAASRRGVTQYVVLGAGLDTFAFRQPSWARQLTILEIDHPASQQFKIATLKAAGVRVPDNVRFFPIDFAVDAIGDKLALAPFDRDRPIFVSWLGVTQYLARDAVGATLRALARGAVAAELVLSYIPDDWTLMEPDEREATERAQALAASLGEPWLSKFSAGTMADLLAASGFSRVEPLTIDEARSQYFGYREDKLQPSRGAALVYATT